MFLSESYYVTYENNRNRSLPSECVSPTRTIPNGTLVIRVTVENHAIALRRTIRTIVVHRRGIDYTRPLLSPLKK